MTIARAYIEIEGSAHEQIECTFNPDKLTLTKVNNWPYQQATGRAMPHIGFGGGQPATLQLTLIFDTTEGGGDKDVRKVTDKLVKLMKTGERRNQAHTSSGAGSRNPQRRPRKCTFHWGTILVFEAALTRLVLDFVLFNSEDGTPVRANATCTFTQVKDEDEFYKQNPTSGGRTGEQIVRLGPRETLDQVAYEAFGTTAMWRSLAAFNGIDDPLRMRAGDELLLPASVDDLKALG
jgi:hypothetical protein